VCTLPNDLFFGGSDGVPVAGLMGESQRAKGRREGSTRNAFGAVFEFQSARRFDERLSWSSMLSYLMKLGPWQSVPLVTSFLLHGL
jgi:hypothetical protein